MAVLAAIQEKGGFFLIFPSTGWSSTVPLSKWFIYCKYLFKWFPILHYWVRCPNLILLILFYPTYSVWHINSQYITGVGCKGGGEWNPSPPTKTILKSVRFQFFFYIIQIAKMGKKNIQRWAGYQILKITLVFLQTSFLL